MDNSNYENYIVQLEMLERKTREAEYKMQELERRVQERAPERQERYS